ncbi:MAG: hypothetical protein ACE361_02135 [Aureliella sp.]
MKLDGNEPNGKRQITVAGVLMYSALWALIVFLFQCVAGLQQDTYTITEARLSEVLMFIATGLLFVAIGLPVSVLLGKARKATPTTIICFLIGLLAIPSVVCLLMILAGLGVVDLD